MTEVILDEICDFINGGAWSDKEYVNKGIPVLKVSNCKPSGFSLSEVNYLPIESTTKYAKNKLLKNDVIIATVGSHPNLKDSAAGRSCIVNSIVEGYFLNQNAVCLRSKDTAVLNQTFLGYLTQHYIFQNYIQMRGRGAANQMRISIGAIKSYKFCLPEIGVQNRIADILAVYGNLIENNQKQIKLLEEAVQRLYKEWFVDFRFPGYEEKEIVDGVPEGWNFDKICNVFSYVRGKSYTSTEITGQSEVALINLKNIQAYGGYKRNSEKTFSGKFKEEQVVTQSDIVMAVTDMTKERRLVGHVAMIPNINKKAIISMDLIKIVPNANINRFYLYSTLRYSSLPDEISQNANGVNVLHLKPESISNIEMIIPSDVIMDAFGIQIEKYVYKIDILEKSINLLKEVNNRLLPRLMSGENEV